MCASGPGSTGERGQVGGRKGPLRVRSSSCRLQGRSGPTGQVSERNMVGRGSGGWALGQLETPVLSKVGAYWPQSRVTMW